MQERKKPGAKSRYDPARHPRIVLSLARRGRTFEEIAPKIGIVPRTLTEWRKKYPEIDQAIRDGHDLAIAELEESMYGRAKGMTVTEKRIIELPGGERRMEVIEKELPPDPAAAKMLMMAWAPGDYADRTQLTDEDGKTVPIVILKGKNISAEDLK